MAEQAAPDDAAPSAGADESAGSKADTRPRKLIPGNLTYLPTPGTLKAVLDKVITAAKPDRFTQDYLATVLGFASGNQKAVIPILKRIGFLSSDGAPTESYSKFRTESGRADAVIHALRSGFAELFKRNEHVYAADDKKLTDLIIEITGLERSDTVVRLIRGTFRVLTSYLPTGFVLGSEGKPATVLAEHPPEEREQGGPSRRDSPGHYEGAPLGLSYQINIVLPETKDVEVYNSIFRSLRDNLLRS